jgi:hypothetical protein
MFPSVHEARWPLSTLQREDASGRADLLDKFLFLPAIWLACGMGISLRLIGPLFIVAPVGLCLLYALLRRAPPPKILSCYFAFCVFIAFLSGYRLMPTSWQVHFEPEAIVRQLTPTLGFFSVAWASKAYFTRRLAAGNPFYAAPAFLFLSLVVAPAVMFQQDRQYQGASVEESILALYGALINNVTIAMFFLTRSVILQDRFRRFVALALILAIGVTTHFIQFRIITLSLLVIILSRHDRIIALAIVLAVIGAYGIGLHYIPEMMRNAPNSGIRLAFMSDALRSVYDSNGLGIGYGVESVRWRYMFPGMPVFTFLPDANTMTHERLLSALSTGVENSFMQSMLRTGVVGFSLFLAAYIVLIPSAQLPRPVRNHATVVLIILVIGCFVNSSLESPLAVVGMGFCYGYLIALKGMASARTAFAVRRKPLFAGLNVEGRIPCPRAARFPG